MKPLNLAFTVVVLIALIAIGVSEHGKAEVAVSSEPIINMLGDTQRELTRLPVVFTKLSDDEEIRIGDALAKGYSQNWEEKIKKDPSYGEAQSYVSQVGVRVAMRARRHLPYKFHYVPDDGFVNAFALPGGHVFIGQGLIGLMDSEDELAAVLGHEIEHIDLGHCAERVQLEARLKRLPLGELGAIAEIPYELFAAGYSKEQELAADANGTELAVGFGYSASGAIRMFEAFEQFEPGRKKASSPQQELTSVAAESLQEYFRTHPRAEERAARIRNLIAERNWPVVRERDIRIGYIALTTNASAAFSRHDYPRAIAFAARSLGLKPDQLQPREVLYSASMYTGHFDAAADAARHLLVIEPDSIKHAQEFADALAAQGTGSKAASEFTQWARIRPPSTESVFIDMEVAGLDLLAGHDRTIEQLTARINIAGPSQTDSASNLTPNRLGRLLERAGHWYYLAGSYDRALKSLNDAHELYLDRPELDMEIGFAALQLNKISTAQDEFEKASSLEDSRAGAAVAHWRAERKDRAIGELNALSGDPKWQNAPWVAATYGRTIFGTLSEIRTEQDHRLHAQKK